MRGLRRASKILKHTGAIRIFVSYVACVVICGLIISMIEPEIDSWGDGLWYCFVASTTVGFGDFYAVTATGRVITVVVTLFGIVNTAMVPGVILAYYLEYLKIQEKATISIFLEKLENLPDLSKEDLAELSKKVKQFHKEGV